MKVAYNNKITEMKAETKSATKKTYPMNMFVGHDIFGDLHEKNPHVIKLDPIDDDIYRNPAAKYTNAA